MHKFVPKQRFHPSRSARFVIFAPGAPILSDFQQSIRVCAKQRFQPLRSARFVIFTLGAPLFSDFPQSTRVCTRPHFYPDISVFCHVR